LSTRDEKVSSVLDYMQFYDLESYLFNTVRKRFETQKYLSAFDFFCIIIWRMLESRAFDLSFVLEFSQSEVVAMPS